MSLGRLYVPREVDLADRTRVAALPSSCPPGQPPLGRIASLGTYRILNRVPLGRIFRISSSSASSRPICLNKSLYRMPAVSTKKWFLKIYYKMLAVSTKKENTKIQFQNPKKNSLQISPIIYMRIMLVDFWTWKRVTERGVSLSLFARFKHSQRQICHRPDWQSSSSRYTWTQRSESLR